MQTERQKAAQYRYNHSAKGLARNARLSGTDKRMANNRRSQYRAFLKFKKALAIRIDCLAHTSPAFRAVRAAEILAWSRDRHPFWVESEIERYM